MILDLRKFHHRLPTSPTSSFPYPRVPGGDAKSA